MNRPIQFLRPWQRLRAPLWGGFCALAVATAGARAEIGSLVIADNGQCLARDFRRIALANGEQDVVFDKIPAQADLTTLQIWAPRAGVRLLSWSPAQKSKDGVAVRCRVRSSVGAPRVGLDLVYSFTGLTWGAHYEAWIRSEPGVSNQAVSADLRGVVQLRNDSGMAFPNVLVRLVGGSLKDAKAKPPGFLLMDRRTPLSDAWFPGAGASEPPYIYPLASRVTIPQRAEVTVPLVNESRVPAIREYVFLSDEIPLEGKDFSPLRQEIRFPYISEAGRSVTLPPGKIRVSVGARRERVFDAVFYRAVPGSEIVVDSGPTAKISGRRKLIERTPPVAGFRTETYELQIRNESESPVAVRIEEKPPAAPAWTVVKVSAPWEERMNRLFIRCTVPPQGRERIIYSVKIREPQL